MELPDQSTAAAREDALATAVGYRVVSAVDGRSEVEWRPGPPWVNRVGDVFGGIVPALVDVATGMAIASACDPPMAHLPTVSMHIDYLRPMRVGQTYTCCGETLRIGGRLAVGDTHIYDEDGVLVVRATATVVVRRPTS